MNDNSREDRSSLPALEPGTRVLIAGASGGIGRETLRVFARSRVVIGAHYYKNEEALRLSCEEHARGAAHLRFFQADLTTAQANRQLVDTFVAWAGGIDVLVQLTGGISRSIPWDELTEGDWKDDLDLNLTGPFFLAQSAMNHMREAGGKIILTSTASARHGGGSTSIAYGVAKAGIECLTRGLAREGAPFRILVNAICPGFIDTDFHTRRAQKSLDDLSRRANLVPLKRAGTPAEVAGMILFLASASADYITGECICISGGDWL